MTRTRVKFHRLQQPEARVTVAIACAQCTCSRIRTMHAQVPVKSRACTQAQLQTRPRKPTRTIAIMMACRLVAGSPGPGDAAAVLALRYCRGTAAGRGRGPDRDITTSRPRYTGACQTHES